MRKKILMGILIGMVMLGGLAIQDVEAGGWSKKYGKDSKAAFDAGIRWMSNPDWKIWLDSKGYSDWMIIHHKECGKKHEMLSGDWMAAVKYTVDKKTVGPMWLPKYMIYPYYETDSNFGVASQLKTWDDPNNPVVGKDTGHSVIGNKDMWIRIDYKMIDMTGEDIGSKNRYVMTQKYKITAKKMLEDVKFYQFLHAQPGDNYGDTGLVEYGKGNFTDLISLPDEYQYRMVFWDDCQHCPNHYDIVGIGAKLQPTVWKLGTYPGHSGKPKGLNEEVENDNITPDGMFVQGPAQVAGVMMWELGDLNAGSFEEIELAMSTNVIPEPCTMSLLGLGLLGIGSRRMMMRKKNG